MYARTRGRGRHTSARTGGPTISHMDQRMTDLDSNRIDELAALLAVAREGTFVAAGRSLQRHATIISRRIAALEARLGVRLIERTTRHVRLTEAGERLAARVRSASEVILDAELEASAN